MNDAPHSNRKVQMVVKNKRQNSAGFTEAVNIDRHSFGAAKEEGKKWLPTNSGPSIK